MRLSFNLLLAYVTDKNILALVCFFSLQLRYGRSASIFADASANRGAPFAAIALYSLFTDDLLGGIKLLLQCQIPIC
jgi:hypothetical protein